MIEFDARDPHSQLGEIAGIGLNVPSPYPEVTLK